MTRIHALDLSRGCSNMHVLRGLMLALMRHNALLDHVRDGGIHHFVDHSFPLRCAQQHEVSELADLEASVRVGSADGGSGIDGCADQRLLHGHLEEHARHVHGHGHGHAVSVRVVVTAKRHRHASSQHGSCRRAGQVEDVLGRG